MRPLLQIKGGVLPLLVAALLAPAAFADDGMIGGNGHELLEGYAQQVADKVHGAINTNPAVHGAYQARVRLWIDGSGRVTRVTIDQSHDTAAADAALTNKVLIGLQVGVPPQVAPMPIWMNIAGKRPN